MSLAESPVARAAARERTIADALAAALRSDRDQFRLALQPIVDSGMGALVGWEVLIRWQHPVLGNVSPGEFIPIAEKDGMIDAIGSLVLEAALRYLVEAPRTEELGARDVSVSVNVSLRQLTRPGFAAEIGGMLEAAGIEPVRLCIEVDESAFTNAVAVATISEIRRLGVLVAVDAFGVGDASLSSLQFLPADIVKLDGSLLPSQGSEVTAGRSFLTAVVALAHAAGLRVAVERVENQVQLNAVVLAGADAVQGFLLGEPMLTAQAMAVSRLKNCELSWQAGFAAAADFAAAAPLAAEAPGVLERLRAVTGVAYSSLETVPAFQRLFSTQLTAAEYAWTLCRLHAFHAALEPALGHCLRGRSRAEGLLGGARLAAIAADLAWCGTACAEPTTPPAALPQPESVAEGLGVLYAIEVSELGGRIIGAPIATTLGVSPDAGGSYLCGLTDQDARRRWQLLQEALRLEIDATGAAWEPVVACALATFGALESWMRDGECAAAHLSA